MSTLDEGEYCPCCIFGVMNYERDPCYCNAVRKAPCAACENVTLRCNDCGYEPETEEMNPTGELDYVAVMQAEQGMTTCYVTITDSSGATRSLTYKMMKDSGIALGDSVLVEVTSSKGNVLLLVGVVQSIHDYAELLPGVVYRWVIQKIDMTAYHETMEKEQGMGKVLRAAALRKQAQEAYAAALLAVGLSSDTLPEVPLLR